MAEYRLIEKDGGLINLQGERSSLERYRSTDSDIISSATTPVSQNVVNILAAVDASRSGRQLSMGWQHYFNALDSDDMLLIKQCGKVVSKLNENDWAFKHTACYWVAISFIFGSLVFTTASYFWLYDLNYAQQMALVNYPYFAGSITFSLGSYISWWETMNFKDPPPAKTVWFSFRDRNTPWWICWWYVVGTTFYYGNTLAGIEAFYLPKSWSSFPWWMSFFGGCGFTLGGICEMIAHKFWKFRPHKLGWWTAYFNFVGGFLFVIAAAIGFWFEVDPMYAKASKWAYLVGSFSYLCGGMLSLVMWKSEQFGLAFMPMLNLTNENNKRHTVSFLQLPFLFMYCCTSAISVSGIVYTYCASDHWNVVSSFVLSLVIPTGVLGLASVIHRVPEKPPYSYLLWFLRFIMAWLTINHFEDCWRLHFGEFQKCAG